MGGPAQVGDAGAAVGEGVALEGVGEIFGVEASSSRSLAPWRNREVQPSRVGT